MVFFACAARSLLPPGNACMAQTVLGRARGRSVYFGLRRDTRTSRASLREKGWARLCECMGAGGAGVRCIDWLWRCGRLVGGSAESSTGDLVQGMCLDLWVLGLARLEAYWGFRPDWTKDESDV